jgi:hypothetical protein
MVPGKNANPGYGLINQTLKHLQSIEEFAITNSRAFADEPV